MASTRRRIALLAAFSLGGLIVPASAGATVFCVPDNAVHASCETPHMDLQDALNAAEANAGNDAVRLGVGTLTGDQVTGFRYFAGDGKVDLIGAGQAQTTLTIPPDDATMFHINEVLNLDASGGGSSVSDLTVALPAPTDNMFGSQYKGVVLAQGQVNRVTVTAPATPINSYGFWVEFGPTTIDDATVSFPAPGGENAVIADGPVQVTDSDFTADSPVVIRGPAAGTHSIDRTSIDVIGNTVGVDLEEGTLNLSNSLIDLGSTQAIGVRAKGANAVDETAVLSVDHATIVGTDPSTEGIRAEANDAANADSSTANISNSVIQGVGVPIRRIADNMDVANVTTNYSNYNSSGNLQSNGASGAGTIAENNQTNLAPGFVNPGMGDYHLSPTSPLLDIGDPMGPMMGALDIDGNARALSMTGTCAGPVPGRRDIGADELSPGIPAACNPPPASVAPSPLTTPTQKKKKCKKRKKKKSKSAVAAARCKKKKRKK